jgi:hypothetical protein
VHSDVVEGRHVALQRKFRLAYRTSTIVPAYPVPDRRSGGDGGGPGRRTVAMAMAGSLDKS